MRKLQRQRNVATSTTSATETTWPSVERHDRAQHRRSAALLKAERDREKPAHPGIEAVIATQEEERGQTSDRSRMFTDDFRAYDDAGGRTFIHARGNRAFRRVTAAMVVSGFSGAVGNTPLIELRELSRELGRRVSREGGVP